MRVMKPLILTAVLLGTLLAGSAGAQQAMPERFKPFDENAPRETIPAAPLVFIAYGLAWVALTAYGFGLYRKVGALEKDVRDLKATVRR